MHQAAILLPPMPGKRCGRVGRDAVSYTHLDVYKRQAVAVHDAGDVNRQFFLGNGKHR